jgi:hypothetical protein
MVCCKIMRFLDCWCTKSERRVTRACLLTVPEIPVTPGTMCGVSPAFRIVQALHNLCKVSKERQAEAAAAGVTPALSRLAGRRATADSAAVADAAAAPRLRALAISMLCALAHSSSTTRSELWTCQGLDLLVELLKEQARRMLCAARNAPACRKYLASAPM